MVGSAAAGVGTARGYLHISHPTGMIDTWLGTSTTELLLVAFSTVAILLSGIAVIRLNGLRSLSKMSSFDFIVTVALGSIVATVAATSTSIWHGGLAFALLLAGQRAIAALRRHGAVARLVDNQPILLMDGADVLHDNLKRTRVTVDDVVAKLREANVTDYDQVLAVVLEATGDISVLHGEGPLDQQLLKGVGR